MIKKRETADENLLVGIDARAINGKGVIAPYEEELRCTVYELLPGIPKRVECKELLRRKRVLPKGTKFQERNEYKNDRKKMSYDEIKGAKLFGFETRLIVTIEIPIEYAEKRYRELTQDDGFRERLSSHREDITKIAEKVKINMEPSTYSNICIRETGIANDEGDCVIDVISFKEMGLANLDSFKQRYILANAVAEELDRMRGKKHYVKVKNQGNSRGRDSLMIYIYQEEENKDNPALRAW